MTSPLDDLKRLAASQEPGYIVVIEQTQLSALLRVVEAAEEVDEYARHLAPMSAHGRFTFLTLRDALAALKDIAP